jgi:hypothetical protein
MINVAFIYGHAMLALPQDGLRESAAAAWNDVAYSTEPRSECL